MPRNFLTSREIKSVRSGGLTEEASVKTDSAFSLDFKRSLIFLLGLLPAAFLAPTAAAQQTDSLNFYKNYLVTGDYAVAGVGLRGTDSNGGTLTMTGVPCQVGGSIVPCNTAGAVPAANVIAAYLYWETEELTSTPSSAQGTFDGQPIQGTVLGNPNNTSCYSSGGTIGTNTAASYGRVYRADVLHLLPVVEAANPPNGNRYRNANGPHKVVLNDSGAAKGNGNLPYTNGATLVVIYETQIPGFGNQAVAPLKSVVIYDGAYTMDKHSAGFSQNVGGFYDAAGGANSMNITPIASNGQATFTETMTVVSSNMSGGLNTTLNTKTFTNPFTGVFGTRWDSPVLQFNPSTNLKDATNYSAQVTSTNNQVCLIFPALITSTPVPDADADGIPDFHEKNGLHLNTSVSPATFGGCSDYPNEPCVDLPKMGARVGTKDVFVQVDSMESSGMNTGNLAHDHFPSLGSLEMVCSAFANNGISLHFDVGNNYQGNSCIIPYSSGGEILAQGGNDMKEEDYVCQNTANVTCTYQLPYPVLSFKRGFLTVKDGNPNFPLKVTGGAAPAHFAHNRKDIFHYALFAHALADVTPPATPSTPPKKTSGIGDRPGGDLMITLGLWPGQPDSVVAGTFMHELGHNLNLLHDSTADFPNCVPVYPSVMNYMYQTRGLEDAAGNEHIDYSYGMLSASSSGLTALNEDSPGALYNSLYKIRFYAPANLANHEQAASVGCGGVTPTPTSPGYTLELSAFPVGQTVTPNWLNGLAMNPYPFFDVNLDLTEENAGAALKLIDRNDWGSLNLAQVGARPNFRALSADVGFADAGFADAGFADAGFADAGFADAGFADAGFADAGTTDFTDENYDTRVLTGVDPPKNLTVTDDIGDMTLNWLGSSLGGIDHFKVYRCGVVSPAITCTPAYLADVPGNTTTFVDPVKDTTESGSAGDSNCAGTVCYNTTYLYYVTAVAIAVNNGVPTPVESNADTNGIQSGEVSHLYVIANNDSLVYGTSQTPTLPYTVYGDTGPGTPATAGLMITGVVCQAAGARNVTPAGSPDPITCAGPATNSNTVGISYNSVYRTLGNGALTITQYPITVTAAASSRGYDGMTDSSALPTITSGQLQYPPSDTVTWTETYDNKNVGTTHTMTPAGVVSDTNGGNNYKVTFTTINTGVITPAPLTIAAATNTKFYDGNNSAAAAPVATGLKTGDSVTGLAETYTTVNAGTNLTLTVTPGYTINDGNNGNNYSPVTTPSNNTGVIKPFPVTVVLGNMTQTYTGSLLAPTVTTTPVQVATSLVGAPGTNAGTYPVTAAVTNTNYTGSAMGSFVIQPAMLTVSATGVDKNFDGTTTATVTLGDNRLSQNDTFTDGYTSANFANIGPGQNIPVNVTGISISGPGSTNYALAATTATTSANIRSMITLANLSLNGVNYANSTAAPPTIIPAGLQLTNGSSETASAWLGAAIPVTSAFTTTFQFQITPAYSGPGSIGDGFAFVIQNAPGGSATLGTTGFGQYIGYTGITNSIAVEFDTYPNAEYGDPASPHIGIQSNGTGANSADHTTPAKLAAPVTATFADGALHTAKIVYDGAGTLSVYLDTVFQLSAPVNLGTIFSPSGFIGFTAATGAASENPVVASWTFTTP